MDRHRFLLTSLFRALAGPLAAEAEQAERVYRVGYLGGQSECAPVPLLATRSARECTSWDA
jgi:hypothetical protein